MYKNLLYLGFIGFRNIGDDVCYDAFRQRLSLIPEGRAVAYDLRYKLAIADIHKSTPLSGVVIGGGSLLQGTTFIQPACEAVSMGLPLWIYGTGIDYFTEEYVQGALIGKPPSSPQMFENKELKTEKLKAILRHSLFTGVRGPMTRQYLSSLPCSGDIHIVGDPGLVYLPKQNTPQLSAGLERFVAVNWGGSFGSVFGHNESRVERALADAARGLIQLGYSVLIYPMWPEDISSCARLRDLVNVPERCRLVQTVESVDSICRMLREAVFSIGLKLHANVLSARMGTPFVSLAYRSKCYDFACSIEMGSQCVSTSARNISDFILRQESVIAKNRVAMQKIMTRHNDAFRGAHEQFWHSIIRTI